MELEEVIRRKRSSRALPSEEDLRSLPWRKAFVYGRVSSQGQVRESHESIRDIAKLVMLAKQDGYESGLEPGDIEVWLQSIQSGDSVDRLLEDGEITVDCRDLGLSGSLGEEKRPGLASLRQLVETGEVGAVYLTEGMSRLSRDRDRILGYKLLKLLKEHRCRIRTPEGIYNPAIPRDWENLAEDIEDSADEMRKLGIRLGRRRASKAAEGRHIGNPVSPGYVVAIEGQRRDGSYILGKWEPYPPHQEIVVEVLKELVKQRSPYKAARALRARGVVYPYFPPELAYMETRSALRQYHRDGSGYLVSSDSIRGLAVNLKLVGIWEWMDVLIDDNHPAIVPLELFLQANEVATADRPRGRAAHTEPMEWMGLLYCCNHQEPRKLSAHNARHRWACHRESQSGLGQRCMYVEDHILTPPLTAEFLRCLDLTPHAQAVLERLKAEVAGHGVEETRRRRREAEIKARIANLERYLGSGNPQREETYWRLISEAREQLKMLGQPRPAPTSDEVDIQRVEHFLENLESDWKRYPGALRNRLLTLLVERVELRHDASQIEATIIWKVGFRQVVRIQRPFASFTIEKRWRPEEVQLLREMWPTASWEEMEAALPDRTPAAINQKAALLHLRRPRMAVEALRAPEWSEEDEERLREMYSRGVSTAEIARVLGRSETAIKGRASVLKVPRPWEFHHRKAKVAWEADNVKVFQAVSSHRLPVPSG